MQTMGTPGVLVDLRDRREIHLVAASLAASVAIHAAAFSLVPHGGRDAVPAPETLSVFLRAALPGPAAVQDTIAVPPTAAEAAVPIVPPPPHVVPPPKHKAPLRVEAGRPRRNAAKTSASRPPPPFHGEASRRTPSAPPKAREHEADARAPATAVARSAARASDAVEEAVTPPVLGAAYLRNPAPRYPLRARRAGIEGTVTLKVLVTAAGTPGSVELQTSSGSDALDRAAEEAVRSWRFVPARRGHTAMDAWVVVPVVFRLESG